MLIRTFTIACLMHTATMASDLETLFEFSNDRASRDWRIVNDGVMGGRSSSRATFVETTSGDSVMRFRGNLSLANNGGFASVRSRPAGSLGLRRGDTIVLQVFGDGRKYTFNLYTPTRRTAFSFQADFQTQPGKWTEVRLPVDRFVAHSFGRPITNMSLTPRDVQSVGILLGDKKPGSFD
ncbi:MAG TPA: CIA30 family protein, partial [Planctomycetaceae bacterium]|nr:CIA30 family protein [Planctomycetaceae bacterium]